MTRDKNATFHAASIYLIAGIAFSA